PYAADNLADFDDANRIDSAVGRRHWQSPLGHQLADEGGRLAVFDRRLHAKPYQTVGVIEGLPGAPGNLRRGVAGVAAAVVADVELGAAVHQHLNDFVPAL